MISSSPGNSPFSTSPLSLLESLEGYSQHFMDLALWEPYVREVYARYELNPPEQIYPGKAGTYPTFIIDNHRVIKFFGRLFDGEKAYEVERAANVIIRMADDFPSPALLFNGIMHNDPYPWHYLIYEYLPGVSIGDVDDQLSDLEREKVAREMGLFVRRLHHIPVSGQTILTATWDGYTSFLQQRLKNCVQDHLAWGTMPKHLTSQIPGYLLPIEDMIDYAAIPHLIHADLTADHLIGRLENGSWQTHGIIDYGDAMVGNLYYELPALHLDLFHCDSRLLRIFLRAYGVEQSFYEGFTRKAMNYFLLHPFNILSVITGYLPPLSDFASLDELGERIWGTIDSPG